MFKSQKLKKWTSLMVALLMTISVFTQGLSITAKAATSTSKVFDLVEITDFHGALVSSDSTPLPVAGVLANDIKNVKASNPDRTLIMGGGDLYQGSPISNVLQGVPVQQVMSSIGMQVTALGNHEFDWTLDTINNTTMKGASYSIVCANLYNKTTGERVYEPYKIITKDGVKIAVIGAITKETPNIVMPANVANYKFTDAATEINAVAKQIKDQKLADVIIADVHAGNNYKSNTGEIFDIANNLTNVDAVFGGHSHTILAAQSANGLPIYIANNAGKGFIDAKMTVNFDSNGAVTGVSFPTPNYNTDYIDIYNANNNGPTAINNGYKATNPVQDPAVQKIVEDANKAVGPTFSTIIGNTPVALNRTQDQSPYGESQLGNWSADVVRNSAKADVGIQNNGGIRTDIAAGDITKGMIYYLMPFDNMINTVMMTKAQLKVALEQAVVDNGKGIQISGIRFNYDPTRPAGNRVFRIVREDGREISDTEKLKVAGPDFILTGGDGFSAFTDPTVSATLANTFVLVRDALINDIAAAKTIKAPMNSRIVPGVSPVSTISIVATSDVHGNVYDYDYATGKQPVDSKGNPIGQGLAQVSTYVKNLRAQNPNVMLVDNGDTIQGTPLSYYYDMIDRTSEYPLMKAMGVMGYDTWTLGNHEYNYGLDTLNRIIKDAQSEGINVLSANTYRTTDGSNFVKPYIIKSFTLPGGQTKKVAIIGLTTKTIPSWEDAKHYEGLEFKDLVDEANKWVKTVKAAGADVVIVTAHSGEESPSDVIPENEIKAIATQVSGIDAIVAGHSHSLINQDVFTNPDGKAVVVTEPGKWAQNFSQIDVNFDANGKLVDVASRYVKVDASTAEDPAVVAAIKTYQDTTLKYVQTKLGTSTDEFTGAGQYVQPTAIMDLVNKVQMQAAGTQLSIAAPLSASAYIPKGDVTIQDIMGVYVYENFLYGVKMTGKQLKDWMEYSVRYYKQVNDPNLKIDANTNYKDLKDTVLNVADYNLDQLYGATYDIDLTQPACTVDKATGRVISGNRIKNLRYKGKLVKDTDVFTVAINNYRYNGGGGFMAAAGLTIKDSSGKIVPNSNLVVYDSAKALGDDGQVRSLMMKYIQDNKTITPTNSNSWALYTVPVAEKPDTQLPNTGSNLDSTLVVDFGITFLGAGAIFIILENRKKKKNIVA